MGPLSSLPVPPRAPAPLPDGLRNLSVFGQYRLAHAAAAVLRGEAREHALSDHEARMFAMHARRAAGLRLDDRGKGRVFLVRDGSTAGAAAARKAALSARHHAEHETRRQATRTR